MKKFFAFLLIATAICFTFAACAGKPQGNGDGGNENGEAVTEMYLTVNENKMKVTLANNSATAALVQLLENGDIVYTANDYGGFEKVGSLGRTLPSSDERITTQAGDVMLYSANQIVVFYGSNKWAYTRIGRIEGYSAEELSTLLCASEGNVQVTLSLD